jgi:SAM-dependent methyltransferase
VQETALAEDFHYTGREELEQLLLMPGYNRHIAGLCLAAIVPGQTLLDFGAGTGTISSLVREQARAAKILCLEIDPANVAALRSRGFDVIADAAQAEGVDVVYSSNVLEHIDDDVAALRKLRACLKPGGRAVFWVPAFECLWTVMDERLETSPPLYPTNPEGHLPAGGVRCRAMFLSGLAWIFRDAIVQGDRQPGREIEQHGA